MLSQHIIGCDAQAGDKVVYSKYAGTEITLGGTEHVLLKVYLTHCN